ncbi:MAG: hypothetical protein Q7T87_16310 [Polaromonas sp.]|nr:hypothetical protein [Polaromonas sp.]
MQNSGMLWGVLIGAVVVIVALVLVFKLMGFGLTRQSRKSRSRAEFDLTQVDDTPTQQFDPRDDPPTQQLR